MTIFREFVDKKERESISHLKTIAKLLKKNGFKIVSRLNKSDPYIFVYNNKYNGDFGGIRIYEIEDMIAYRVQMNLDTAPFGKSYSLNIESMFEDLLADNHKPKKAGEKLIKAIVNEINTFFKDSAKAEKELSAQDNMLSPSNPMNRVISRVTQPRGFENQIYLPR